jgi:MerR family mercuric resistance operon transcriptional regulator
MVTMTIGQLARKAGVGVETIRFYERKGLVTEPARRASGYRQYDQDMAHRIRFIRHAKALGFTLREIAGLLELRVEPDSRCSDVLALAEAKIVDVQSRIEKLQRIKLALSDLTRACRKGRSTGPCPILKALDQPNGE